MALNVQTYLAVIAWAPFTREVALRSKHPHLQLHKGMLWVWKFMSMTPEHGRQRQESHEFKARLIYIHRAWEKAQLVLATQAWGPEFGSPVSRGEVGCGWHVLVLPALGT